MIGREGKTAKAIRDLLRVIGWKEGARVNLKIDEPEGAAPAAGDVSSDEMTANFDNAVEEIKGDMADM